VNLSPALKGTKTAGSSPRLRRLLVSVQVGLSLLLLVGAGLFVRTLQRLSAVDLGFRAEHVLTFQTDPSRNGYEGRRLADLYTRLRENIAAIPGVGVGRNVTTRIDVRSGKRHIGTCPGFRPTDRKGGALILRCSASFLSTMQIPLLLDGT